MVVADELSPSVPPITERAGIAAHFASDEDVQHYQLERGTWSQELIEGSDR
jgi:hypothetical protein